MKFRAGTLLCVLSLAFVSVADAATPTRPNYNLLSPCKRSEQARFASIYAESLCGTISVYEDRARHSGRKIPLNVMVIRAREAVPRPDPVFFLAGGPGQAATEAGPMLFSLLDDMRKNRDIVLVDQRGTGKSNSLVCKMEEEFQYTATPLDALRAKQISRLKDCLAHYKANPALYTTPIAMDDLNEVRRILGFDKINLYGISYGTRAALVYMRRHGDTLRSVILDSVVPMTMNIPVNVAVDAQAAFDKMISDCKTSRPCNDQFPELDAHFKQLMARLKAHPADVKLNHPLTGAPFEVEIDPRILSDLIRSVLYDRTLSALLPLSIHLAWTGNYEPIMTLGYSFTAGDDEEFSLGMMASVLCSEDMSRSSKPNNEPDFENAIYNTLKPICNFWPKGNIPDNYFKPVRSAVPTLLFAGKLDPITPPKYALEAAATLSDSQVVIVPGVGHSTTVHGCIPDLMAKFLTHPDPKILDTGCVAILKRPEFFTSLAGTAPVTKKEKGKEDD